MTEDDARQKWCPMVRYPLWPDECSGGNEGARCIASDCMMWRWDEDANELAETGFDCVGYCGLANKP